ncbi:MAG: ASCH domain-containing protein [Pseudomonadota bacterium]
MSSSLQSLGVVGRLYPLIRSGEKTSTIRWREKQIAPGPLQFFNDDDPSQSIEVIAIACTEMPLSDAANFVGRADEWPDQIMLEGMREHYPEIELTSTVQVIEFKLPSI